MNADFRPTGIRALLTAVLDSEHRWQRKHPRLGMAACVLCLLPWAGVIWIAMVVLP